MIRLEHLLKENSAQGNDSQKIEWLLGLTRWLKLSRDIKSQKRIPPELGLSLRIKYLIQILNANPNWETNFTKTVSELLRQLISTRLFTEAGIVSQSSFIQDSIRRIEDKILPQKPLTDDLSVLLYELFPEEIDIISIDAISEETLGQLLSFLNRDLDLNNYLRSQLYDSLVILSGQMTGNAINIHRELNKELSRPLALPELILQKTILDLDQKNLDTKILVHLGDLLNKCEDQRQSYYKDLENLGVKIDLIYALDSQKQRINRLHLLIKLLDPTYSSSLSIRQFLAQLLEDVHQQRSLISFFSNNLSLLTRRIVQRNSDVGEHYVTFNKEDFRKMFYSALGGGAFTSITVFIKFAIGSWGLKGFLKGLAEGINYSGSFLLIQTFGWTLATKQPSTTAPFLTQSLKKSLNEAKAAVLAILRTQTIAVIGNLALVFPICLIVSVMAYYLGHPILSEANALYSFRAPSLVGPSPLFAAFTGVLLFLSSLIAGWFDNWVVIHNLAKRIEGNRSLNRYLSPWITHKFASLISTKANAIAANISLGLLLGLMPQYLQFLAIPLEVRHITLSTGAFAASLPIVLQDGLPVFEIITATLGLLVIGIINISVSFGLALFLAALSSKVKFSILWKIVKWGLKTVLTKPSTLFIPDETAPTDVAATEVR